MRCVCTAHTALSMSDLLHDHTHHLTDMLYDTQEVPWCVAASADSSECYSHRTSCPETRLSVHEFFSWAKNSTELDTVSGKLLHNYRKLQVHGTKNSNRRYLHLARFNLRLIKTRNRTLIARPMSTPDPGLMYGTSFIDAVTHEPLDRLLQSCPLASIRVDFWSERGATEIRRKYGC